MNDLAYRKILELASQPDVLERSVEYIQQAFSRFLLPGERVLICFAEDECNVCRVFEEAVRRCGGVPMVLGKDRRWMTILKTAFTYKCNAIIAPPLLLLGLSKLARHMGTPLYTRNVVFAGYPSTEWMVAGIQRELDCQVWGCYDPGAGAFAAGFSCDKACGIHLRWDECGVDIVDAKGNVLPENTVGHVILYPRSNPQIRFDTADRGMICTETCQCGSSLPRLKAIDIGKESESDVSKLADKLQRWTSILDCRLEDCGYGMELEMVVFPGEKLPKLPSFSKMSIRPWNPEVDEPFDHSFALKKRLFHEDNH